MPIALISVSNFIWVHEGRSKLLGVFHLGKKKYETLSLQQYLTTLCEGRATLPPFFFKSSSPLSWMNKVLWSEMLISNPQATAANTFYIVIHKGMPLDMSSHFSSIIILISHPNDFSPETWARRRDKHYTHAPPALLTVRRSWVKRGGLLLRDFLHFSKKFTGGGLVKLHRVDKATGLNSI